MNPANGAYLAALLTRRLPLQTLDASRMTLAFFGVAGLVLLGELESALDAEQRAAIVEWVYAQQTPPRSEGGSGGFRGGPFLGVAFDRATSDRESHRDEKRPGLPVYDQGHIAATYSALGILKLLGDDLARVDRASLVAWLGELQAAAPEAGAVRSSLPDGECDIRFSFCLCATCALLDDWTAVSRDAVAAYIHRCQAYDGAFGQNVAQEGHGGSTYCALASLELMGLLDAVPMRERLLEWLVLKQSKGFHGRPDKPDDVCYSWWIGASVRLLEPDDELIDVDALEDFLDRCVGSRGGVRKLPPDGDGEPGADPLHTYFALAGLSAAAPGRFGLVPMNLALGIPQQP